MEAPMIRPYIARLSAYAAIAAFVVSAGNAAAEPANPAKP